MQQQNRYFVRRVVVEKGTGGNGKSERRKGIVYGYQDSAGKD